MIIAEGLDSYFYRVEAGVSPAAVALRAACGRDGRLHSFT
jgi:hypothetical protein